MKDALGKEIYLGDRIAYAQSADHAPYIDFGTVLEVRQARGELRIQGDNKVRPSNIVVRRWCGNRVLVVSEAPR